MKENITKYVAVRKIFLNKTWFCIATCKYSILITLACISQTYLSLKIHALGTSNKDMSSLLHIRKWELPFYFPKTISMHGTNRVVK